MSITDYIVLSLAAAFEWLLEFSFMYPLIMSILWITGSSYYFFYRERREHTVPEEPPPLSETPGISFMVPCHNEAPNIQGLG